MSFSKKIDVKQIQLIHIARAQCGLSEDEYRDTIAAQTKGKKHSSKDMTYFEADALINYFVKTLGFKIRSNYIRTAGAARRAYWHPANARRKDASPLPKGGSRGILPANVFVLPSRDQMDMIDVLTGKITWKLEDGFARWLKKYIKINRVSTADQASRTIEGLKGLLSHSEPVASVRKPKANYPRNEVDGDQEGKEVQK
jgi:hypothetical protein